MKNKKKENRDLPVTQKTELMRNNFPGYPAYPVGEDIYNKAHEEKEINPEFISGTKDLNETDGTNRGKFIDPASLGSDLDVPGSELDDNMESIGSEDEENNYYSIGGDDHNDLDEDKGV